MNGLVITILTLNVAQGGAHKEERYAAIQQQMEQAKVDVVCLQEIRRYSATSTSADGLLPGWHRVIDGHYGNWNQGIFSRYPIKRTVKVPYPTRGARWALGAVLDVKGKEVLVLTTHLDYALGATAARTQQINALFAGAAKFGGPAVVTGDFNFGDQGPESRAIPKTFTDVFRSLHPDKAGFTWDKERNAESRRSSLPGEPSRRLDRILTSKHFGSRSAALLMTGKVRPGLQFSDHFGVVAQVLLL
ncbi:MAG: endonuclease/exonuclease/phosphatase family metal-dependent hydrolase [Myxococcota bacterium]|jgi:endonuclease/exonuclease/phosphatase family metal-dependent hydrolase